MLPSDSTADSRVAASGELNLKAARMRDLHEDRHLTPGDRGNEQIVRAFGPVIYGLAAALLLEEPSAPERIAPAVFRALNARWAKLSKGTLLAVWLFQTTLIAARRERKRQRLPKKLREPVQVALFRLNRLRPKLRDAVVLRFLFGLSEGQTAAALGIPERKAAKRCAKGLKRLRSRTRGADPDALLSGIVALAPPGCGERILPQLGEGGLSQPLVRDVLVSWRWIRVRLFLRRVVRVLGVTAGVVACCFGIFIYLAMHGYLMSFFISMGQKQTLKQHPELLQPARPWPVTAEDRALARNSPPGSWDDLFQLTNIWPVKLTFTPDEWRKIEPSHVPPVRDLFRGERVVLRNPRAKRSGLSGVLGFQFNWVEGRVNFAGAYFDRVGVRYRGNGTYLGSLYGSKQSLKLDLHKYAKTNQLAEVRELNLLNTVVDYSFLHDPLAEELFRELGAVAPRTAYAYVTADIGNGKDEPRGLFVLVENVDADFAQHHFENRKTPIFKPVTYDLFQDLGDDWTAYQSIYDLKTKATPEQEQRLIDFAKLVSHATDEEFARRLPEFLEMDEFAAFLAGSVLLASYDGFLTNGQNYYMYLDPRSDKFGFISWDQDHSWGDFGHAGTTEQRENASIWKPSTYDFRFLDRVLRVEAFRKLYRDKLEQALAGSFTKDKLFARVDTVAQRIRPAVAAESDFRLQRFDQAISNEWLPGPRDGAPEGPDAPVHQIKRFITNRIQSVRDQLDGKTKGLRVGRLH